MLEHSGSNWNLEMLVFAERGKPEYPEKNLLEQRREPTTNSTHIWRRVRESNPSHIGGKRVLSPLCHPCSPKNITWKNFFNRSNSQDKPSLQQVLYRRWISSIWRESGWVGSEWVGWAENSVLSHIPFYDFFNFWHGQVQENPSTPLKRVP